MKRMPKKKPAMSKSEFTRIFTQLKETAKLSPSQIAEGLGVNRVSLYRWTSGERTIDKFTAAAIRAYAATKLPS